MQNTWTDRGNSSVDKAQKGGALAPQPPLCLRHWEKQCRPSFFTLVTYPFVLQSTELGSSTLLSYVNILILAVFELTDL